MLAIVPVVSWLFALTDGGTGADGGASADGGAVGEGGRAAVADPGCDVSAARRARKREPGALARLVDRRCDLSAPEADGYTPLMNSMLDGDNAFVLWLLDHGADPRRRGTLTDQTVLHRLVESDDRDHVRLLDALVRHGADVNATTRNGQTPLHVATGSFTCADTPRCESECAEGGPGGTLVPPCWLGATRMVRALLAHGADPNRADVHGSLPLFQAAAHNQFGAIALLLGAGARPRGQDGNGDTLWDLMAAPDTRVVRYLLAHGADANERDGLGRTALHAVASGWDPLDQRSDRPLLQIARLLLAKGARVDVTDEAGQTPLHEAASNGFSSLARLLLDAHAAVDARDKREQTPLHRATWGGRVDTVAVLLARGARPQLADRDGLTPLHYLGRGYHVIDDTNWDGAVRRLIAHGALVDAIDRDGRTPLWHAMAHSGPARALLAAGADRSKLGNRGASLLHLATYLDQEHWVFRLLAVDHVRPDVRDDDGRTALHWAAFFGHLRVAERLVADGGTGAAAGTDVGATDRAGRTALDWAIAACQRPVAEYLIQRGAPAARAEGARRLASACPVRPAAAIGNNLLHRAAERGGDGMKDLLDHGAPVDGRDAQGRTPLHRAAEFTPNTDGLAFLIRHGARVDATDGEGRTPLHVAASKSNVKGAAALLAAGAQVNATDDRGRTPLHLMSQENTDSFELYRLLVARGANLAARDRMGRTPLHAAYDVDGMEGGRRAGEILVCHGASPAATDQFGWTASDIAKLRAWRDPGIPSCSPASQDAF